MFEKDLKIPLLLDVYGAILTERKREMMEYYYYEDYSLAEISEVTGISRQGVRDSLKKTVAELHELEDKLHMAERLQLYETCIERASDILTSVRDDLSEGEAKNQLNAVLSILKAAEETQTAIAD